MIRIRFGGLLLAAALVSLFSSAASAQLVGGPVDLTQWGTTASTSTASCPSFCTSFNFGPSDGGTETPSAASTVSDSRGNAAAEAQLDASSGISLPRLRAEAYVTGSGSSSAFGRAVGVEGYTNTGPTAVTLDLDITLTGSVFDPTPADGDTSIEADINVFGGPGFLFGFDYGTLVFELGVEDVASSSVSLGAGDTLATDVLSFTVQPGESFFVQAQLSASAERDLSWADSFSTLTLAFQDPAGLTSASGTVVPEPGTALLFMLGLGGLSRSGRRAA